MRLGEWRFVAFGLLGYFVYWLGVSQSYRAYDGVAEPTVLNYTFPVFTVLFTELLFRRRGRRSFVAYAVEGVGVALAFLSMVLMVTGGNPAQLGVANPTGLLWGLLGGASYGLFSAYSSTVPRDRQLVSLVYASGTSVLAMGVLAVRFLPNLADLTLRDWLIVLGLGLGVDGIG